MSPSVQRVVSAAAALGLDIEVHEFPEGTRTAADAAAAIGCDVATIVKSLVFCVDTEVVVALVPGDRRLDPAKLGAAAGGERVERASLDLVRQATGFAAGGTPPIGHVRTLRIFADVGLRQNNPVWVAAGTPTTVFPVSPEDLARVTSAVWADLSS